MKHNQKDQINKPSQLERLRMFGGIILGLFVVNSILFIVSNQFQRSDSLIKVIKSHENIRD